MMRRSIVRLAVLAAAVALAGCGGRGRPAEGGPAGNGPDYVQFHLVSPQANFKSKMYILYGGDEHLALEDTTYLDASDLVSAAIAPDDAPGRFRVTVDFTGAGSKRLHDFLESHRGRRAGVLVGGLLTAAPAIMEPVPGKEVPIMFHLSQSQAMQQAALLNARLQSRPAK